MSLKKKNFYIFLDIDGVLIPSIFDSFLSKLKEISNNELSGYDNDNMMFLFPECVYNFKLFLNEIRNENYIPKIIITSEWRRDFHYNNMAISFAKKYDIYIHNLMRLGNEGEKRDDIILEHINLYKSNPYIVIDDMLLNNIPKINYVQCNSLYGITKKIKNELIKKFHQIIF